VAIVYRQRGGGGGWGGGGVVEGPLRWQSPIPSSAVSDGTGLRFKKQEGGNPAKLVEGMPCLGTAKSNCVVSRNKRSNGVGKGRRQRLTGEHGKGGG